MVKVRLTASHRKLLKQFVKDNVVCEEEQTAYDDAYNVCYIMIKGALDRVCSESDLSILTKHNCTKKITKVQFSFDTNEEKRRRRFEVKKDHDPFIVPTSFTNLRADVGLLSKVDQVITLKNALDEAERKIIADYSALIDNTRNFNDLVKVWPACQAVAPKIINEVLPEGMEKEQIDRIKKTNIGNQITDHASLADCA